MKIKPTKQSKTLFCISLAWFLVLGGRYSISNLFPTIVSELDFSWTDAGIALTVMYMIYAIVQFPSGIISDIKGRKITIIVAMLIFSFAYLIVGLSSHYVLFVIALILLGLGSGGYPAVGISMLTDVFKEKRGKALGIRDSAGSLAYIIPIVAAFIAGMYYWRLFFYMWAGICFLSVLLFYILTSESTTLPKKASVRERVIDGMSILRQKNIQLMFAVNLLIAITWISYMSFFPSLLIVEKGFTEIQAALGLAILGIGGFIFKPIIGSLSDRYNKKIIIIILSMTTAVGTLVIVNIESLILILLISFIPSLATAIFPVITSYLMDQWPEKGRAGKIGFYRSSLILLASPSTAVIGYLKDVYNFKIPFLGISFILFLVVIILTINILINKK
jgi:MFS family permease